MNERTPLVNADGTPKDHQAIEVAVPEQVQRRPEDEAAKALEDKPDEWTRWDVFVWAFWVVAVVAFSIWFALGIRNSGDVDVRVCGLRRPRALHGSSGLRSSTWVLPSKMHWEAG